MIERVPPFSGLLLVDKPTGMTSHDVVLRVRRRLASPGVGHLGTLDPGASGLLVMALGAATRAIAVWQGGAKTYEGRARFGVETSTQDVSGEVLARQSTAGLDLEAVVAASRALTGELAQVPPMVSAIQVGGERLHRLARRGITVERQPRPIRVDEWKWWDFALPEAAFRVRCSGGTYVRTLVHDLGRLLGTGAALATLRRVRSEPFGIEDAVSLESIESDAPADVLAGRGIPLDRALEILPAVCLDAHAAEEIGRGGQPRVAAGSGPLGGGPRSVVFRGPGGQALALGDLGSAAEPGVVFARPQVVFPWAVRSGPRSPVGDPENAA